ncbi:MAG TPA: zinc ribbon domain-containing protein [Desulfonatronum sp.]|nr:zinc ribbon domain-containing protein [Desulfonatronum sp.]
MPIFEYHCTECGKDFEELVFGGNKARCPHCRSEKTEKLISRCRHKSGGASDPLGTAASAGSGSSCSGCTASSCAGCH